MGGNWWTSQQTGKANPLESPELAKQNREANEHYDRLKDGAEQRFSQGKEQVRSLYGSPKTPEEQRFREIFNKELNILKTTKSDGVIKQKIKDSGLNISLEEVKESYDKKGEVAEAITKKLVQTKKESPSSQKQEAKTESGKLINSSGEAVKIGDETPNDEILSGLEWKPQDNTPGEETHKEVVEEQKCKDVIGETCKGAKSALETKEATIPTHINSPIYPQLKRLKSSEHLTQENFDIAIESLKNGKKQEEPSILSDAINTIEDGEIRQLLRKEKNDMTESELSVESIAETDFYKDFNENSDIPLLEMNGEKPSGLDLMLINNYISIPNKDGTENKKEDLSLAIDIVLNKIINKQSKSFVKDNFDIINKIRNGGTSLSKKYENISNLYKNDKQKDFGKSLSRDKKRKLLQDKAKAFKEMKRILKANGNNREDPEFKTQYQKFHEANDEIERHQPKGEANKLGGSELLDTEKSQASKSTIQR